MAKRQIDLVNGLQYLFNITIKDYKILGGLLYITLDDYYGYYFIYKMDSECDYIFFEHYKSQKIPLRIKISRSKSYDQYFMISEVIVIEDKKDI